MAEFKIKISKAVGNIPMHEIKFTNDIQHYAKKQAYDEVENDVTYAHPNFYTEGDEYTASLFRINNNVEKEVEGMPVFSFTLKNGKYHLNEPKIKFENEDK